MNKKLILLWIFLVVALFLFVNGVYALEKSTSIVKTQYFSPGISNPYNAEYSFLQAGPRIQEQKDEIFDLVVAIPPLGCKPAVVRSDLLEEQPVPVFCQLMAVKVNPAIDISRLDRIVASEREKSPYVAGIGFHPSRAAIRSTGKLISTPIDTNIGYVVIVLKQIPSEKEMPDFVEVNLSAHLLYGSEYSFGIGKTEFFVPVLDDLEWANDYKNYGFFKGQGYLRVEDIDEKGALVSIYRDADTKIYSSKLEKGKIYDNVYIANRYGGQGLKILVEDFVIPETKAKIIVGDDIYEVYSGEKFADNCQLRKAQAYGGGTGYVDISCGSEKAILTKDFGKVNLKIDGMSANYKIGDKIEINKSKNIYAVYSGITPSNIPDANKAGNKAFVILAETPTSLTGERLVSIRTDISRKIGAISASNLKDYEDKIGKLSTISVNKLYSVFSDNVTTISGKKIEFSGTEYENKELDKEVKEIYDDTKKSYEEVIERFGNEGFNKRAGVEEKAKEVKNKDYAQEALCQEYRLAKELMQNLDAREFLMKLNDDYPDAKCADETGNIRNVKELLNEEEVYNDELTKKYFEKENLYVQLISVASPSEKEASVNVVYVPIRGNNFNDTNKKEESLTLRKGDIIADLGDNQKTKLTLVNFDENTATIAYSCEKKTDNKQLTRTGEIRKQENEKEVIDLDECNGQILIEKINMKKAAKIKLIPKTFGKSVESNFSVKIGIEKRAVQLSPEKALERIANLNKTIEKWSDINNNLGKLVEGGKAACLATSAALTIKNFFTGMSGEAAARQEIMTMGGGWNEICQQNYNKPGWNFASVDACLSGKSEEIKKSVEAMAEIMKNYNKAEEARVKAFTEAGKGILGTDKTDYNKVLEAQLNEVKKLGGVTATKLEGINLSADGVSSFELRELEVNAKLANSLPDTDEYKDLKKAAQDKTNRILNNIYSRGENRRAEEQTAKNLGIDAKYVHVIANRRTVHEPYETLLFKNSGATVATGITINPNDKVTILKSPQGAVYLAVLVGTKQLSIKENSIYKVEGKSVVPLPAGEKDKTEFRETTNVIFDLYDASSYHNRCENCDEAKFYNSGSYKGLPQLIPFDVDNGWYVATKPLSPLFGEAKTYQDSGRVNSFYVCNVDGNKRIDGIGAGDDDCRRFDMYTGDTLDSFHWLSREESKRIVAKAIKALEDASRLAVNNPKTININGKVLKVIGVSGVPGNKCTDSMSPGDCKLLFNVCDPFVCPNSRCDLGGNYQVDDVIQSGVIGSLVLCLPNFVGFGGDVYVPVCLTGIHAGVEGWVSILQAHQSCLQEHIKSGKMIGLCDEIYSIYQCDFFWKQLSPFLQAIVKGLLKGSFLGTRGGGEYLFVDKAFENAENSWKFFTSSYASNSKLAFGAKSFAEIGTDVCKRQFSVIYPDKFKGILEPESPTQFTAWFDEMPYSDATIPSTSQYKVFYHIYAGEDNGAYYTVYLKSKETALGYVGIPQVTVASGYVGRGEIRTETKDFTAVSGFKELCVRINAKDECGFKQVSSSFAINYAKDVIVAEQAKEQVTSEAECISGSSSIGSLLNPNLQAGVEEVVSPELYNQGVIRVCSSRSPGEAVEPGRWKNVGYCSENIRCWLDVNSVKNAIKGKGIENATVTAIDKMDKEALIAEDYYDDKQGDTKIGDLKRNYNAKEEMDDKQINIIEVPIWLQEFNNDVNKIYLKLVYNFQRADILYYKAEIYDKITRKLNIGKLMVGAEQSALEQEAKEKAEEEEALIQAGIIPREKWTLDTALNEIDEIGLDKTKGFGSKYSDNKGFIDELYADNILTIKEYKEINGEGSFNSEENLAYVKKLLLGKKATEQRELKEATENKLLGRPLTQEEASLVK